MYTLEYESGSISVEDKKEMLSVFTEELFYNLDKPFRVLKDGKEVYKSKALCAMDFKGVEDIDKLKGCSGGACSIPRRAV